VLHTQTHTHNKFNFHSEFSPSEVVFKEEFNPNQRAHEKPQMVNTRSVIVHSKR